MRVAQLWRYPVKSMQGELVDSLDLDGERVPGDRRWGVRDVATGAVLTGRATGPLLHLRARLDGDGVCITLPDGRELRDGDDAVDDALSEHLGQSVRLARAETGEQQAFSTPNERWQSRPGTFNDGHHVHVLSTASLRAAHALHPGGAWEARRFRPNVVLDVDGAAFPEDDWTRICIGAVELEVYKRTTRCPLTTRSQPGLDDDLTVLKTLTRNREAKLGVYARVSVPGRIHAGADVAVA